MFDGGGHFDFVEGYLEFYGFRLDETVKHEFIEFESGGCRLAGHTFEPRQYQAVVFVLHGFLDHCGFHRHLVRYLTGRGFAVACFDMPGHGLSGSKRAGIDDFSEYSEALRSFADIVKPKLSGPYHLIGHSLGGAVVLDYLLLRRESAFDKVILAAPLVRCWLWRTSKICFGLYWRFFGNVPRVFRRNSSDMEFLRFVRTKDCLRALKLPTRWVRTFYEWNDKVAVARLCDRAVKVIQGTMDTTVEWRFNIKFIEEKFGCVEVKLIEGGRHELFNESEDIRAEVFSQISSWLR